MALAPPQQLSRRERVRLVPPTADAVAAVALAGLALVETWATAAYEPRIPYVLAALAMTLPLAWRRAAPLLTLVVALAVLIAMDAAGNPLDSAYIMAVLILAFYSVGAHLDRVASVTGWLLGVVLIGVLVAIEDGVGAGDFVFVGTIVTAAWVLATAVHRRTEQTAELEGRAARFEQEREVRAREAVADERARIARELHDIVAHSLSIVVVQTAAVRRRLRGDRPSEAETLDKVEAIARDALQEMRRLLGILRSEEDPVSLAPQPGMREVDRLVTQMRAAGLDVDLRVDGEPRPIPPGVDLVAYRIVQESLVNVLKHAGEARASVVARYDDQSLALAITDTGRGPHDGAGRLADDGDPGHGLIGMRERVALYGGWLQSGAGHDGGFAVRARLPLGGS